MSDSSAQSQSRGSLRLSAALSRGLRESGAIALAVIALVLCVALLSFDPRDPGFSFSGNGGDGINFADLQRVHAVISADRHPVRHT